VTESVPPKRASASDHLANERTLLAWLRTSIATMAFGIVIDRLQYSIAAHAPAALRVLPYVGTIFVLIGLLTVAVSLRRFAAVRRQLIEDRYEPDMQPPMILSVAIVLLGIFLLAFLLVGP
jgi:putative membrane protein